MNYLHVISLGFFMITAADIFKEGMEGKRKRVCWLIAAIAVAIGSHWA